MASSAAAAMAPAAGPSSTAKCGSPSTGKVQATCQRLRNTALLNFIEMAASHPNVLNDLRYVVSLFTFPGMTAPFTFEDVAGFSLFAAVLCWSGWDDLCSGIAQEHWHHRTTTTEEAVSPLQIVKSACRAAVVGDLWMAVSPPALTRCALRAAAQALRRGQPTVLPSDVLAQYTHVCASGCPTPYTTLTPCETCQRVSWCDKCEHGKHELVPHFQYCRLCATTPLTLWDAAHVAVMSAPPPPPHSQPQPHRAPRGLQELDDCMALALRRVMRGPQEVQTCQDSALKLLNSAQMVLTHISQRDIESLCEEARQGLASTRRHLREAGTRHRVGIRQAVRDLQRQLEDWEDKKAKDAVQCQQTMDALVEILTPPSDECTQAGASTRVRQSQPTGVSAGGQWREQDQQMVVPTEPSTATTPPPTAPATPHPSAATTPVPATTSSPVSAIAGNSHTETDAASTTTAAADLATYAHACHEMLQSNPTVHRIAQVLLPDGPVEATEEKHLLGLYQLLMAACLMDEEELQAVTVSNDEHDA